MKPAPGAGMDMCGVSRKDKIKNELIRGAKKVAQDTLGETTGTVYYTGMC